MAVTAAMVKELREMTGAGMMDCKKALAATDGDMDKAVEFLREKGLAGATKKAGRIAAEGIVMTKVTADEKKAVVVEVNAETDFVAKNEKFQNYVSDVAEQAHRNALQLAENTSAWKGFEVLVATHKDKKHIHTHFIVNSVNFEDGHKLQWSSADLQELKERCNAQSREQGLHVSEKGKTFEGAEREETVAWKKETYQLLKQAEQGKVKSYVQDIALAVLDCKETATSRESFIRLMNERGYGVDWQDSHKYITYTDLARKQAGEKACKIRNNKLEKYYNMGFGKEELEHEFERNARTAEVRAGKSERTDPRTEPSEPDRAGEQPAEGSLSFVERELRGIDEAVKSRTSKGRAEQAERRRAEQAAHQRAEEASRAVREQQRTTSERHISRNWEPER